MLHRYQVAGCVGRGDMMAKETQHCTADEMCDFWSRWYSVAFTCDDSAAQTFDASLFCRAAKAMEVEKHNILQELAEEAELADMEMKAKLKQKHIDEIGKELDKVQNPFVRAHSALLLGSDFVQSSAADFFAWVEKAVTR